MGLTAFDKSVGRKGAEGPEVDWLLLEAASRRDPPWPRLNEFTGKREKRGKGGRKR